MLKMVRMGGTGVGFASRSEGVALAAMSFLFVLMISKPNFTVVSA
jgi:hypothetical protein